MTLSTPYPARRWFGLPPWLAVALAAVLVAVVAVEAGSFVGLQRYSAQMSNSPEDRLARVQRRVTFTIRQPAWLPPGMRLQDINYELICAYCTARQDGVVDLTYGSGDGVSDVRLTESGTVTFEPTQGATNVDRSFYDGERLVTEHVEHGEIAVGNSTADLLVVLTRTDGLPTYDTAILTWSRDGMHYYLSGGGTPGDVVTLRRIAGSI